MDKRVFICIFCAFLLAAQTVFGYEYSFENRPNDLMYALQPQEYVLHVPAGATVSGVLSEEINSNTALVGQVVNVILTDDFIYNSQRIAPSGSVVTGSIVFNKKAGLAGKCAQLQIRFTTIRTPYNNVIPVSAVVATSDNSGILKGNTTAVSGNNSVLNGGLGVAKAFTTKGDNIKIEPNSRINLFFDQPITLGAT